MAHPSHKPRKPLSDAERIDWLRLIRSENVGPVTFSALIGEYGGAAEALAALPELAARGGKRRYQPASVAEAEAELRHARACGAQLLTLNEDYYPPLLRQIEAPPPALYIKGRLDICGAEAIAIVGSRNASALGQGFAKGLSAEFGAAGLAVVSGLARGVDAAAHWGALESGTVAVVAGGVDVIYPLENGPLYQRIAAEGAVISECPPGFQPRGQDFPRRNRLISGISYGVVVVEAARQSGSLITARFALEQNREVFAVPGHPLDPRAAGPNELIRSGATLIRNSGDALSVLRPLMQGDELYYFSEDGALEPPTPPRAPMDLSAKDRDAVLTALSVTPVTVDDLIRATGLSARAVNVAVLELTLAGKVRHEGLARIAAKPERLQADY